MKKLLILIGLFFMGLAQAHASDLPDELLNAPIHLSSGDTVRLADYQGKRPVYLKFWATWCQPCRKQMPHFEHVQQQYGKQLEVIAINLGLNDDQESINKTIKEFGLTMPMAVDSSGDLAQKFRLVGTPYHLLFDKNINLVHIGHEADESLDNKLALVSQVKPSEIIGSQVLNESEQDIQLNIQDGKAHALFFTATWCDWYLQDSRPSASKSCIQAQNAINELYKKYPNVEWLGAVSRLWTGDNDLQEYIEKYGIKHRIEIDKSNRLSHQYQIKDYPVLLLVKDGKVQAKFEDFNDTHSIAEALDKL